MRCQQCSKGLKPSSDSEDFCDEVCQRLWNEKHPLAGFGISMRQVEEALEVAAPALQAAGWSAAAMAPTKPASPLEVVADAPTPVDPNRGFLSRAWGRLFG